MRMLHPVRYHRSVRDIDLGSLLEAGKDTLLLDLDNTLLPRDSAQIPERLRTWAGEVHDLGFKACLVSNNWHERVYRVADELGFRLVSKAVKPLPFAFLRALSVCGSTRKQAVVIGDQLFTDILGGNLLGIETVLVEPLSEYDLPHTLALRRLERLILKGRSPVGD